MSDIYLVNGWKVPLEVALAGIDQEAIDLGMRSVIHAMGKDAYIGEVLLKTAMSETEPATGVSCTVGAAERLKMALRHMGLERLEAEGPLLWVVIG